MLQKVRLFVIMAEFGQYKKSNQITNDQFKKSFKKVVCAEYHKHEGKEACSNDILKVDAISKKLLKVFDTNKNGKLEFQEAVSAFCILCKGSVQSKIKYLMMGYSEVMKEKMASIESEGGAECKPADMCIRFKNLKKFMLCVLKLALESGTEIMLDFPMDKLAQATAEKCMEFAGVTDHAKGTVSLEQVTRFIDTANPVAIFTPPEGNDPSKIKVD